MHDYRYEVPRRHIQVQRHSAPMCWRHPLLNCPPFTRCQPNDIPGMTPPVRPGNTVHLMHFINLQLHPNKLTERAKRLIASVVMYQVRHRPARGLDLVRDLYCSTPSQAGGSTTCMGFPNKLQFSGPEQAGITRCEINYS